MKSMILIFVAALALLSCKNDDNKRDVPEPDKTFAMNAAAANQAEIQISGLVSDRSVNTDVKKFASHMIDEHMTALTDLKMLANDKDLTLAYDLDSTHLHLRQKLMALSGPAFDTVFMNSMVKDHRTAVAMFQAESNTGQDEDLKAYADKYLPHLSEHLKSAQQLQSSLMANADTTNVNNGRKGKE
jgi:putative membrane protein